MGTARLPYRYVCFILNNVKYSNCPVTAYAAEKLKATITLQPPLHSARDAY